MRKIGKVIAILSLILASLLGFIGLMALPSGGLMFALPYIFLMPAGIFCFHRYCITYCFSYEKNTIPEERQEANRPPESIIRPIEK